MVLGSEGRQDRAIENNDEEQMSEELCEAVLVNIFLQCGSGEGLHMEAIVTELERVGFEFELMATFMSSERFHEIFNVDCDTAFSVGEQCVGFDGEVPTKAAVHTENVDNQKGGDSVDGTMEEASVQHSAFGEPFFVEGFLADEDYSRWAERELGGF